MEWLLGAVTMGAPLIHGQAVHKEAMKQAQNFHDQQIRLEIELARRDILQEMRDQKADKLETLMVMDTLMLGCCFAILVEGMPPRHTWRPLVSTFAFTLASSLALFFLSVWFVMKVQSRMSRYNILNPDHLYACGYEHGTFHSYFLCHCLQLTRLAKALYYAGVLSLVVTATLLVYSRFMLKFRAPESALIFVGVMLLFVVTVIVLENKIVVGPRLTQEDFQGHSTLRATLAKQRAVNRFARPEEPANGAASSDANGGGRPQKSFSDAEDYYDDPSPAGSVASVSAFDGIN